MVVIHEHRSKTVTARRGTVEFTISNFSSRDDFDRAESTTIRRIRAR